MKKRFGAGPAVVCFAVIAAWSGIARAQNAVYIGTDEFTTGIGTEVQFPFVTGKTTLKGKKLDGFKAPVDSSVERQTIGVFKRLTINPISNVAESSATVTIQMTALSLTGNLTVGTTACTVDITLDPANLANDRGTMTLYETDPPPTPVGGWFDSTLNVYYEAVFRLPHVPFP
jgi:hypothetical protein